MTSFTSITFWLAVSIYLLFVVLVVVTIVPGSNFLAVKRGNVQGKKQD